MLLLLAALVGCATYAPQPITPAAVEKSLAPPAADALRVLARDLKHPLLRAIDFDARDGLSPDEAAILAVLLNPSLRAARDSRGIAEAAVLSAGILPNPSVSLGAAFPLAAPGEAAEIAADGSWELSALVTRRAKVDAATAAQASVALDIAWQEWQIALAARSAVIHRAALEEQVAVAREVALRREENLQLLQQAAAVQQTTGVALAVAEAAAIEAHATVLGLERARDKQVNDLAALLGLSAGTPVALQAGYRLPAPVAPPRRNDLLGGLEDRRLDLVALRRGYDSQEASVRAAIRGQFPKVSLGVGLLRDFGRFFALGPSASVDLPLFDRNQGAIAGEEATRQKLYDEYVARVFEARAEIAAILGEIEAVTAQTAAAEAAVPSIERLIAMYQEALAQGQGDILSFYGAEDDLSQARLALIGLRQELALLYVSLELAAGAYLPDVGHAPQPTGQEEPKP